MPLCTGFGQGAVATALATLFAILLLSRRATGCVLPCTPTRPEMSASSPPKKAGLREDARKPTESSVSTNSALDGTDAVEAATQIDSAVNARSALLRQRDDDGTNMEKTVR
mmetsp:Transcript_75317/g.140442  ORF Transcript_75317/g.140442 Transcript_75317/m.140442 type:complete len:111 (+) Transcript_75317:463-795(+)